MSKMISPLTVEKKVSNLWLFMDFKPIFVAYVVLYIFSIGFLFSGYVKMSPELPVWLAPLTDAFNTYITDHFWIGQHLDLYGSAYSRAERELIKFTFGISFAMLVLYNSFTVLHILLYLPRLWRSLSSISERARKIIWAYIFMQALALFASFDGAMVTGNQYRATEVISFLYPLLFNLFFVLLMMSTASAIRRSVISHAQLHSKKDSSRE